MFAQGLIIILGLALAVSAWALPCHHPGARFESMRLEAFDNPVQSVKAARESLQAAGNNIDLSTRVMCSLQLSLGAYLADRVDAKDEVFLKATRKLAGAGTFKKEAILLEALQYASTRTYPADLQDRLRYLDTASRPMGIPIRSFLLYLITALVEDPVTKAGLEAEVEALLAPAQLTPEFERVLLLEFQAFHIDRNRNPHKKVELRESFLPRLRKLNLAYWEAFIVYNHARTFEYLATEQAFQSAARYYGDAENLFRLLEKDDLYASILLGKAGVWYRNGRKAEAIRLAKRAEAYFLESQNRIWQGEVWKRLAMFYLEDKQYEEASRALDRASTFFAIEHETDRNQLDEIRARIQYGLRQYDKAVETLETYAKDFTRIENKQREQYVKEQSARYGLTLEEERNKIRQLTQENAKKQALMDGESRKARERGLLVRFFAVLVSLLGVVWLVWILRRGLVLGQTIRRLNSHMENHVLERFLPPAMVHEVAAGRLHLDERPNTRLVTILSADIVSFTNGTESLGSERIAVILNRFMVAMADVIFEHQGTIDKFIGDGVIAIFGAPVDMDAETQALQASRCAQAMVKVLDSLNQELLTGHTWKLRLRIGMHQGVALVGSFGTRQRSDYGAIGDAVHIASRIQAVAGPNEILLTTSVKHHLDSTLCSRRGDLKIRDQSQAISMHSLSLTAELKAA
ncbi:MAG TPA: adenylate/guanylate cyclase domain-containing protein [Oligoflexus sp.]|uniref:adenylate/guanylate cyclase domain-containing protein n=1 Tax=Oligoflexus sp. TaxID=1971216 RepID=UPI002D4E5AD4|nr:adenylate/guanylate cyclase domain-containing protein [Oligoflexus sp.]HYX39138.1 adenylate/guanylate cyclase domain-containing protein [Oligoflexus sp.]